MNVRVKFIITIAAAATLITLLLGGFVGYRYARDLEDRFTNDSIDYANVVADCVAMNLVVSKERSSSTCVGIILYFQIVKANAVLDQTDPNGLLANIPEPALYSERLWLEKRSLPNRTPYLDIIRLLDLGPNSNKKSREDFIRLGISLAPVSDQVRAQLAQIAVVGLVTILLMTLGAYWLANAWLKPAPASSPPPVLTSATLNVPNIPEMSADGILLKIGDVEIDDKTKRVRRGSQVIAISPREFALLKLLASEPGRVFSSEEILKSAWGDDPLLSGEDVKKYIYQLRQKLETDPANPQLILTIRGFGYRIAPS